MRSPLRAVIASCASVAIGRTHQSMQAFDFCWNDSRVAFAGTACGPPDAPAGVRFPIVSGVRTRRGRQEAPGIGGHAVGRRRDRADAGDLHRRIIGHVDFTLIAGSRREIMPTSVDRIGLG